MLTASGPPWCWKARRATTSVCSPFPSCKVRTTARWVIASQSSSTNSTATPSSPVASTRTAHRALPTSSRSIDVRAISTLGPTCAMRKRKNAPRLWNCHAAWNESVPQPKPNASKCTPRAPHHNHTPAAPLRPTTPTTKTSAST